MELISILAWPVTVVIVAVCLYWTYKTSQDKRNEILVSEIDSLQQENSNVMDDIKRQAGSNLSAVESRLNKQYADLEAKVTIIQNGLQWGKK